MQVSLSELSEVKGIGKKTIKRIREYKLADEGYISEYDDNLHLDRNSVNQGDCLELMNGIPDKSVNMILADLPYEATNRNEWDRVINLDKMWQQYKRVIKDKGAIVLTATQPFVNKLINSSKEIFRYDWIWEKSTITNVLNAKRQPVRNHEHILVFYKNQPKYNPQGIEKVNKVTKQGTSSLNYGERKENNTYKQEYTGYPRSVQKFKSTTTNSHPTQKPVALFEYLIKTYTNEGDLVLDNTAGSGTTGVACQNTGRDYILIEKEKEYYDKSIERVNRHS